MRKVCWGVFLLMSQAVFAGADCTEYAENERMRALDLQKKLLTNMASSSGDGK